MAAELIFNCLMGLGIVFYLVQAFLLPRPTTRPTSWGPAAFPSSSASWG